MRFSLLLSLITALVRGIIWLCAGSYLTLLVDRFITVRVASMLVDNLEYDGGGLRAAGLSMTFGSIGSFYLTLCSDASDMVVLTSGGRSFALGSLILHIGDVHVYDHMGRNKSFAQQLLDLSRIYAGATANNTCIQHIDLRKTCLENADQCFLPR